MQFLIVDDDLTNLRLLQAALESDGHAVVEATNGIEAFEVLEGQQPIEAIISGILMPGMDGFRFCHELRRGGSRHANYRAALIRKLELRNTELQSAPGIGLANADRIVTRHGGSIWAEGGVGVGAAFFFSLPRAQPARSGMEEYGQNSGRR